MWWTRHSYSAEPPAVTIRTREICFRTSEFPILAWAGERKHLQKNKTRYLKGELRRHNTDFPYPSYHKHPLDSSPAIGFPPALPIRDRAPPRRNSASKVGCSLQPLLEYSKRSGIVGIKSQKHGCSIGSSTPNPPTKAQEARSPFPDFFHRGCS